MYGPFWVCFEQPQHSASIFFLGGNFTVCRGKDTVTNADLQYLISTLPRLIDAGVAVSTKTKYARAWRQWELFCADKPEVVCRPADPFFIAIYFNHLLTEKGTRGSLTDAMYGIRWGHISAGYHSPTDHPFVKLAYEGAKRLSNYTGTHKNRLISKHGRWSSEKARDGYIKDSINNRLHITKNLGL